MTSTSAPQQGNLPTEGIPQITSLDSAQVAQILRNLPGLLNKPEGDAAAAQILSGLAQQQPGFHHIPQHQLGPFPGNDPGPSTHPRGPPNLNQISVVPPQSIPQNTVPGQRRLRTPPAHRTPGSEGSPGEAGGENPGGEGEGGAPPSPHEAVPSGRTRGGRAAGVSNDEWARQRKDNHKEVERRRRGNINEGINELGRIVPNGSGEKAKGAILQRAVQYIHHLKENEARNIEKWTLEKLLMDQAMGDLQAQLDEMRRMWEQEREARQRLETDLTALRSDKNNTAAVAATSNAGAGGGGGEEDGDRGGKRKRTE